MLKLLLAHTVYQMARNTNQHLWALPFLGLKQTNSYNEMLMMQWSAHKIRLTVLLLMKALENDHWLIFKQSNNLEQTF